MIATALLKTLILCVFSKEFLDIKKTIECRFALKHVRVSKYFKFY